MRRRTQHARNERAPTHSSSSRHRASAGVLPRGTPLLQAARTLGVDVDSVCGGRAICGRCQVLVMEGEFAKHGVTSSAAHLSAVSAAEESLRASGARSPPATACPAPRRSRATWSSTCRANSQVHRQVVRKAADARPITLDPVMRLHYVEVREPDMHDPSGRPAAPDSRRCEASGTSPGSRATCTCCRACSRCCARASGRSRSRCTTARQIIAVWPGFHEHVYGLAVDVGSTTIAGHLCDLETGEVVASSGLMNPQIRFGEDLMSRVSYSMMNPGGAAQMTEAVRAALNTLAAEVARQAKVPVTDILEMTLVGNPIMHHLLLGIDPVELGGAPFALATDEALTLQGDARSDSRCNPGARVYILPCIAGHVGADAAGVILAERPDLSDEADAARRRRHQRRDRARQPRSACSPARARPGLRSRARRSAAASAPPPGRSSACASIPRRSSRASR